MDAQWSDDFHHALHARLTGERRGWHADLGRAADLAKAWRSAFVLDGGFSRHRDRHHGRPVPRGTRSDRFLAYAQTHDQVGNRARGERLCHLVPEPAAELAAALVLLSPFVPMLFQGEEWAASTPFRYVADHADPALAEAVRTGRRREFAAFVDDPADVPDPCDPATLRASVLDWSERSAPRHARALDWHRRLIRLRRERPELAPGRLGEDEVASAEDPPWLRVRRRGLLLAFSLGPRPADVPLGEDPPADVLLTNDPAAVVDAGHVRLGPYAMIVLGPSAD
jgi:maltooligosyltrehalose trehalohydrolase